MKAISNGQLTRSAAEVYDAYFVPALFAEWAPRMTDAAQVESGQNVFDVVCGTGLFASAAEFIRRCWNHQA